MSDKLTNKIIYSEFDFNEFYNKHSYNVKTRTFLNYIDSKYSSNKIDVLQKLNEEDILDSLKFYINTGVQYQITALNYFTYVIQLFDELSQKYNIKNRIFIDKEEFTDLNEKVKQFAETLKKSSLKEIASDDEYIQMRKEVEKVRNWIDADIVYEEIINRESGVSKHFRKLVSVLATYLVLDYGIKGNVLTNMEEVDYDITKNILCINGIDLSLSDTYRDVFKLYMDVRNLAVSKNDREGKTTKLFVKTSGDDFKSKKTGDKNKQPDFGKLFCIAGESVGSVAMEKYAYYRIIQMLHRGIDIITIYKLTGFSLKTIERLLEYYNDEIKGIKAKDYFSEYQNEDISIDGNKEGYMQCPVCHKFVSVSACEWIVVQYEDSQTPILVCKYCGGKNEKNYI